MRQTIELFTLARDQSTLLTLKKPGIEKEPEVAKWVRVEQMFRALYE